MMRQSSVWDGYRRSRRLQRIGVAITVLLIFLVDSLSFQEWWHYLVAIPILIGMLLGLPYNYWKCPRCGSKYSDGGNPFRTWQPFRNSCLHCELPRWQEPSEWEEITPSVPDRSFSPHVRAPVDLMIKVRERHRNFLTLVLRDDPGVIGSKNG